MKYFKIAGAAIAAILLASCGGNKSADTENASDTDIMGVDTIAVPDTVAVVESAESSATSSADIDELIDAYDKMMTRCISMSKRAAKGDVSVVSEYNSLLSELEEYNSKLDALQGEMTPAQAARFSQIAAKQAQAASELAGDAAKMAGNAAEAAASMQIPGF